MKGMVIHMLSELSLHILDLANNSLRAEAKLLTITIDENTHTNTLMVTIEDDGCGMDEKQLESVVNPFFTTRTTRKVGFGVPFFKMAAELCDGSFSIISTKDVGTKVEAKFTLGHINLMPMGDIAATYCILAGNEEGAEVAYRYIYNGREFMVSTVELREILGDIPLSLPEVSLFIKEYINENTQTLIKSI